MIFQSSQVGATFSDGSTHFECSKDPWNLYIYLHLVELYGKFIGKLVVPLGWYPSCFNHPRSPLKRIYPINTHYIRCIQYTGLIIKGPPKYYHIPYDKYTIHSALILGWTNSNFRDRFMSSLTTCQRVQRRRKCRIVSIGLFDNTWAMKKAGLFSVYGGFLKWWYPTTMGFFLLKMIILGCFGGTII